MSTSPSRALERTEADRIPAACQPEPFPYDKVARSNLARFDDFSPSSAPQPDAASATREAQIRQDARREGQLEAQKSFEAQLARERSSIAAALAQFTRDRATYFQKIEGEVVQLALSIAGKILHRESQLDPLLLAGIVRVALERIDGATGVILRVHPNNAADWHRYLATQLEPADLPEFAEDPSQPRDSCILETAMGTTELGLDIQLKEVERGLMDLLAARPGSRS